MMFLTLEDEFGLFEVTLFPDVYRRCGSSFTHYGPYVVTGKVEQQYGALTVSADRVVLRSAGAPPATQEAPVPLTGAVSGAAAGTGPPPDGSS
jgi:DNA polymerase III alpha subunit